MMKNIKDITISIFAVIGFIAIITAFNNQPEQANQTIYNTPELLGHVWEITVYGNGPGDAGYLLNKVTGEVRKLQGAGSNFAEYAIMKELVPKQKKPNQRNCCMNINNLKLGTSKKPLIKDGVLHFHE